MPRGTDSRLPATSPARPCDGGFPQGNGTDLLIPCPAVPPGAGAHRSSSSLGETAAKGASGPGPPAGTWEGKEPVPRAPSPPPVAAGAAGSRPQHRDNGGGIMGGSGPSSLIKGAEEAGYPGQIAREATPRTEGPASSTASRSWQAEQRRDASCVEPLDRASLQPQDPCVAASARLSTDL